MKLRLSLIFVAQLAISQLVFAQADCLSLKLIRKGSNAKPSETLEKQSDEAFYFYRNCIYNLGFTNQEKGVWQIVDFSEDMVVLKRPFSDKIADTTVAFNSIESIILDNKRNENWYKELLFEEYDKVFALDTTQCRIFAPSKTIYTDTDTQFTLHPYLNQKGINYLYQDGEDVFYYNSDLKRKKRKHDHTVSKRYGIWFTPNKVEYIYGIALGVAANNRKNKFFKEIDSLHIYGLNLELNFQQLFKLSNSGGFGPLADDYNYYLKKLKPKLDLHITGFNLSLVGTHQAAVIRGFNFTEYSTVVYEIEGVSISLLNNFAYKQDGLVFGLVNRCTKGDGLQLGAFNRSEEFYGIQIGLWNVIGDKSRPIINWNFKK